MRTDQPRGRLLCLLCLLCAPILSGCRQDMHDQPKYEAYERSDFFRDERSSRPLVEGTVARGHLKDAAPFYTGKTGSDFVDSLPMPMSAEVLSRGRERFGIFCAPCHGQVGRGDGMVVRRGYRQPASFHEERLRSQPVGYFFDAITNGFGAMPNYAGQIPVADRWAIVAYVRALQLSQHASLADVPPEKRGELAKGTGRP